MTKKQPKKSVESDDNFLDHDELEMVSSDRHAWTFDQIIMVAEKIPREEVVLCTWTVPTYQHTMAVIRALSEDYGEDISSALIMQAALEHGLAMFEHKHSDVLTLLNNLERTAIVNDTIDYFDHSVRIGFGRSETGKYPVRCTGAVAALLSDISGKLRAHKKDIAGACILMSLLTDDQIPNVARKRLQASLAKIELTITLQKVIATSLI